MNINCCQTNDTHIKNMTNCAKFVPMGADMFDGHQLTPIYKL